MEEQCFYCLVLIHNFVDLCLICLDLVFQLISEIIRLLRLAIEPIFQLLQFADYKLKGRLFLLVFLSRFKIIQ